MTMPSVRTFPAEVKFVEDRGSMLQVVLAHRPRPIQLIRGQEVRTQSRFGENFTMKADMLLEGDVIVHIY